MDEYLLAWEEAGGRLLTYKSNSKKPMCTEQFFYSE